VTRTHDGTRMQQPIPPSPANPVIAGGSQVRVANLPQSPTAVYQGFVAQRSELRDQLDGARSERRDLTRQLKESSSGADHNGIEQHITEVDARITALDKQLATADAQVAQAAAVPGAVVREPPYRRPGPPDEVYFLSGMFIVIVMLPLSLAYARRIWRRGSATMASLPRELMERLTRLDQSVDSIAVEVERIGEGQRFVTRVLGERAAQPLLDERSSR
jgi:hypothetical protein